MPPTNHSTQPDHCSAGAGSTGQSKQRAGSGPSHFTTSLTRRGRGQTRAQHTPRLKGKASGQPGTDDREGWRLTSSCCRQKSARQSRPSGSRRGCPAEERRARPRALRHLRPRRPTWEIASSRPPHRPGSRRRPQSRRRAALRLQRSRWCCSRASSCSFQPRCI
jgi:hypothetical protein